MREKRWWSPICAVVAVARRPWAHEWAVCDDSEEVGHGLGCTAISWPVSHGGWGAAVWLLLCHPWFLVLGPHMVNKLVANGVRGTASSWCAIGLVCLCCEGAQVVGSLVTAAATKPCSTIVDWCCTMLVAVAVATRPAQEEVPVEMRACWVASIAYVFYWQLWLCVIFLFSSMRQLGCYELRCTW